MSKCGLLFIMALSLSLSLSLPSGVYAVGMGGMSGMGSMGAMVDKVYLETKDVGKVLFSHSKHGTHCNICHPKLFEKKASAGTYVTMEAMERGKSCGACHNGKKAFSVTSNCTTCHAGEIKYQVADAGNVDFSHAVHIEMFGCDSCHPDLYKPKRNANGATMAEMENGESCGACHDGSTAFSVAENCEACHQM